LGRFHVTGNWETILGAPPVSWGQLLDTHDIACLDNRRTDIGPLILAGVEDLLAGDARLDAVLDEPVDKPLVLLAHTPVTIDGVVERSEWRQRVGLVLSGHTHGGQIRLPGIGAPWLPNGTGPYVGGWYEVGGIPLFVSRGVGWSLLPLRMWCPPELAMIELTPGGPAR
jgi:predicted MPP superfamily phosphohydrolase